MTNSKIDINKKYKTRDGRDVRLLCVDGPCEDFPIIGIVEKDDHVKTWTAQGGYGSSGKSGADLVEVKEKKTVTVWVNIYPSSAVNHTTKGEANIYAGKSRMACKEVTIEYEEGEGLKL